jgi:TRAP-type C4-dicarboxylate transport system substrate-binding protein
MSTRTVQLHRTRRAAAALVLLVQVAASPAHAQARGEPPTELKLSTAQAPAFPLGQAGERWAQVLNEAADGGYVVKQYPGATLALRDPAREFGALADGQADLAIGSALAWSAQCPPLAIFALPWLGAEPREQVALADDATLREKLFSAMAAAGVVGLAIAPLGEHVVATAKAPVATPAAADGLRIRVAAPRPVVDFYLALGALPQSLGYAQAQAAFAAGTLDGQDAMPTALAATRAYATGQKFVTRWGALADAMVFAVRKAAWDAWPEERRLRVRAVAERIAREADALPREEAALAQLTKEGVTIVRLSSAQRSAMRDAAQPAIAKWEATVGADVVEVARSAVARAGSTSGN